MGNAAHAPNSTDDADDSTDEQRCPHCNRFPVDEHPGTTNRFLQQWPPVPEQHINAVSSHGPLPTQVLQRDYSGTISPPPPAQYVSAVSSQVPLQARALPPQQSYPSHGAALPPKFQQLGGNFHVATNTDTEMMLSSMAKRAVDGDLQIRTTHSPPAAFKKEMQLATKQGPVVRNVQRGTVVQAPSIERDMQRAPTSTVPAPFLSCTPWLQHPPLRELSRGRAPSPDPIVRNRQICATASPGPSVRIVQMLAPQLQRGRTRTTSPEPVARGALLRSTPTVPLPQQALTNTSGRALSQGPGRSLPQGQILASRLLACSSEAQLNSRQPTFNPQMLKSSSLTSLSSPALLLGGSMQQRSRGASLTSAVPSDVFTHVVTPGTGSAGPSTPRLQSGQHHYGAQPRTFSPRGSRLQVQATGTPRQSYPQSIQAYPGQQQPRSLSPGQARLLARQIGKDSPGNSYRQQSDQAESMSVSLASQLLLAHCLPTRGRSTTPSPRGGSHVGLPRSRGGSHVFQAPPPRVLSPQRPSIQVQRGRSSSPSPGAGSPYVQVQQLPPLATQYGQNSQASQSIGQQSLPTFGAEDWNLRRSIWEHREINEIRRQSVNSDFEPMPTASYVDLETMELDGGDLFMSSDVFEDDLLSQLTSKLGLDADATLEPLAGSSDGMWSLVGPVPTLSLKLVSSTQDSEADKYFEIIQQHPYIMQDPNVAFPIKIFRCKGLDPGASENSCDLIVTRTAPGEILNDTIAKLTLTKQSEELMKVLNSFGCFLADFHKRYGGKQHGDCQPANVSYDAATKFFTMLEVSGLGNWPQGSESDAEHFMRSLNVLSKLIGDPAFGTYCKRHFAMGYESVAGSTLRQTVSMQQLVMPEATLSSSEETPAGSGENAPKSLQIEQVLSSGASAGQVATALRMLDAQPKPKENVTSNAGQVAAAALHMKDATPQPIVVETLSLSLRPPVQRQSSLTLATPRILKPALPSPMTYMSTVTLTPKPSPLTASPGVTHNHPQQQQPHQIQYDDEIEYQDPYDEEIEYKDLLSQQNLSQKDQLIYDGERNYEEQQASYQDITQPLNYPPDAAELVHAQQHSPEKDYPDDSGFEGGLITVPMINSLDADPLQARFRDLIDDVKTIRTSMTPPDSRAASMPASPCADSIDGTSGAGMPTHHRSFENTEPTDDAQLIYLPAASSY